MIAELVQIAAMAQRMAEDVCAIDGKLAAACLHPASDNSRIRESGDGKRVYERHCPDCGQWSQG